MGILDKLTMSEATKAKGYDPIRLRRRKMAAAIQDQLALLKAEAEGQPYRKTIPKRSRDLETDAVIETEHQRRVSPWWWTDDDGHPNLAVRYGSATLRLKGDKSTVVFKSLAEVATFLTSLRAEVLAGGLDGLLAQSADGLKARFSKSKS